MKDTTSLCEHCYRHVHASVYEKNNSIWMSKECPEHGSSEYMIERNARFYNTLEYTKPGFTIPSSIMIEVTDRCNLQCPHCYHEPEAKVIDKPINKIIDQLKTWPQNTEIILAGAEPTVRKDLPELVSAIRKYQQETDQNGLIMLLTNGVNLCKKSYVEELKTAGVDGIMLGLNHHSYQGQKVHDKQIDGIKNCAEIGLFVYYVGYTVEDLDHLPDILEEIQYIGHSILDTNTHFRIRAGSDIGRSPEEPRWYLSDHVSKIRNYCRLHGHKWEKVPGDDNIYHYMVNINGLTHRLIQWSDPKTIDMEELMTPPWCDFVPGKPITNFLHQVMLRDAAVNNNMELHDTCPKKYWFKRLD